MKKFKTFSVKIEEGLFVRLEALVKARGVNRNAYVVEWIVSGIECDEVTPKTQVTPTQEVTPKEGITLEGVIKRMPKPDKEAPESLVIPKDMIRPFEGDIFTTPQGRSVPLGYMQSKQLIIKYYQLRFEDPPTGKALEEEVMKLMSDPTRRVYYEGD